MLGCTLLLKNEAAKAMRIFENAVNELQLDSEEGQKKLSGPNHDLACLLYNYIKCLMLIRGQGKGASFFEDAEVKKLCGYLDKAGPGMKQEMLGERQKAADLFD